MADTESTGAQTRELDKTPTWAVAGVCAVIIIISIVLEKVLHKLGTVSVLISALIACEF
jgi:mlo protein